MLTNNKTVEDMNLLTQSPIRVQILELLGEDGGHSKSELTDRFDVSRITIRRNLDALKQQDLVCNSAREYEITPLGEVVVEDFSPAIDAIELVRKVRPFLRWFPEGELSFDVRALADATVVVADSNDPYAPVNRHIEALKEADHFRCLLPAIGLQAMSVARDRVVEHECRCEIVYSEGLAPTIQDQPEYKELAEELHQAHRCELLISDRVISFYLGLFGQRVQIGVEDNDGMPRALVETNTDEVREWAEQTYEKYRMQADYFTP